jgi:methionine-rich copper-binding protein CopC
MPLTTSRRLPIAVAIALLLAAGMLLGGGQQAFAHADLESSNPAEDEVLSESPEQIEMVFGQELARQGGLPSVIVVNEAGDVLAEEPVLDEADRTRLTIDLPPALGTGRYTVIWHTLSDDDGEEAQGAFHFYIGEGGQATPADSPETAPPTGTTIVTQPAGGGANDGDGVPWWALVGGVAVALVVGTSVGVTLAGRRAA